METLNLEIVTPNGSIYNAKALEVTLPGEEGEFGVLPHHASLTTLLSAGVIEIVKENKSVESVVVNWGVVQVDEHKVVVLVDGAVAIRGESEGDIAKALDEAKSLISDIGESKMIMAHVSSKIESAAHKLI
jgi:F-type H+-transporting ATPase subunit epsilon